MDHSPSYQHSGGQDGEAYGNRDLPLVVKENASAGGPTPRSPNGRPVHAEPDLPARKRWKNGWRRTNTVFRSLVTLSRRFRLLAQRVLRTSGVAGKKPIGDADGFEVASLVEGQTRSARNWTGLVPTG